MHRARTHAPCTRPVYMHMHSARTVHTRRAHAHAPRHHRAHAPLTPACTALTYPHARRPPSLQVGREESGHGPRSHISAQHRARRLLPLPPLPLRLARRRRPPLAPPATPPGGRYRLPAPSAPRPARRRAGGTALTALAAAAAAGGCADGRWAMGDGRCVAEGACSALQAAEWSASRSLRAQHAAVAPVRGRQYSE